MRDPNRIDKFCDRLAAVWKTCCPDQRFGQFIMNAFGDLGRDPFFPEDEEMISFIEQWAQRNSPYASKPPEEKTCRDVMLRQFPHAVFAEDGGACAANVFGRAVIRCEDWRDCAACWDQPAPAKYQEDGK